VLVDVSDKPLLCNVSVGVLWCVDVLAPRAWAFLLLFVVFGWSFSVAIIKTVAA